MNIEYFVEGKAVIRTGENYVVKSNETIVNNAAVSVEQKGAKTGVSYDKPQEINPNDKPVESINVTLNLFFDGTQNNKTNTDLGGDYEKASSDKDDSYNNEYTNVARGFDAIKTDENNQTSLYIEGIGTEDKESDSVISGVLKGEGGTGIVAKVARGCKRGAEAIVKKIVDIKKPIDTLIVNVFGFSRGAAAARHFIHLASVPPMISYTSGKQILQIFPPEYIGADGTFIIKDKDGSILPFINQYGYFGACLAEKELKINKIKFRFAGLYDTVASFGLNHRGGLGVDNDTKQLGLDTIGNGKVDFVLQIASDDEYRDNFDLTNIKSTGIQGLELTLPGVHSDIGGSYGKGEEISVLYSNSYDPYDQYTHKECQAFKKILVDEGWYRDEQLKITYFYQKDVNYDRWFNKLSGQYYGLVGTRKLDNAYDKIPLNMMFHYSKQFGLKYIENRIYENHRISDPFLSRINNQLLRYMNVCNGIRNKYVKDYNTGGNPSASQYVKDIKSLSYLEMIDLEDLKILRNQYLHWSVKANQIGLSAKPNNDAPKKEGALEAKYRKRNIQDG